MIPDCIYEKSTKSARSVPIQPFDLGVQAMTLDGTEPPETVE